MTPDDIAIRLSNQAAGLLATPQRNTAFALLKRAVSMSSRAGIKTNLAIAHTALGNYAAASEILHGLVTMDNDDLAAWHAYGVLSLVAAIPEDAVECFRKCTLLDPGNGNHRFDYALALMQAGRWQEGWEAYEARKDHKPERIFPGLQHWDGSAGKKVYVWAEQGLGDTFQFARYLPLLRQISQRVILAIPPSLFGLFDGYRDVVDILKFNEPVENIDCEVSLMSLPLHLGATPDKWPVDPGLIAKNICKMDLEDSAKLKVGLCWACGPSSHHHLERSLPFKDLIAVTENAGASFYSLQVGKDAAAISLNNAQTVVKDLSPSLTDDWSATASAIKALDMVVTTDTSVAHLASALNKPTIMFLARRDWWRWGNSGDKTPWYPSMTIIRQQRPFHWDSEIQRVSAIIGQAAQDRCADSVAA